MSSSRTQPTADALHFARVVGEHGVKGALRVHRLDPESQLPEAGMQLWLRLEKHPDSPRRVCVERVSHKPGSELSRIWLQEFRRREEAQSWRGAQLLIDRDQLPELDEDEFYLADLIGLSIQSIHAPGLELGEVQAVIDNGMQDLLEVQWQDHGSSRRSNWLLPAVEAYIDAIDEQALWVDLPIGLLPAHLERAVEAVAAADPDNAEGDPVEGEPGVFDSASGDGAVDGAAADPDNAEGDPVEGEPGVFDSASGDGAVDGAGDGAVDGAIDGAIDSAIDGEQGSEGRELGVGPQRGAGVEPGDTGADKSAGLGEDVGSQRPGD